MILIFNICLGMNKPGKIDRKLLLARHKLERINLAIKQAEEEIAIPSSDEEADDEINSSDQHADESEEESNFSIQPELVKNQGDIEDSKLSISSNRDTNSTQLLTNNQHCSFFGSWSCEKACLGFIGIIIMLKILFHYYVDTNDEDNPE